MSSLESTDPSKSGEVAEDAHADVRNSSAAQDLPADAPDAYIIPRALAQATLDYLAAHPYREVFALVRAFEALEPAPRDDSHPLGG